MENMVVGWNEIGDLHVLGLVFSNENEFICVDVKKFDYEYDT